MNPKNTDKAHKMNVKISQLNEVQWLIVRYIFENEIDLSANRFAQLHHGGLIFTNKAEHNTASSLYQNFRQSIQNSWDKLPSDFDIVLYIDLATVQMGCNKTTTPPRSITLNWSRGS